MKMPMKYLVIATVALFGLSLAGCGPEKARILRSIAIQYRVELKAAIDAVDRFLGVDMQLPPRSVTKANDDYVNNILRLPPKTRVTPELFESAIEPFPAAPDSAQRLKRREFRENLMEQYVSFAAIFDGLEKGSFDDEDVIATLAPSVEELTIEMAALAKSICNHPPILLQHRSALTAEINQVRDNAKLNAAAKRPLLIELKEQWEAIKVQELDLQRGTVEKCLKAAIIGIEVRRLVDTYDNLPVDVLNSVVSKVLDEAGGLAGVNFSELRHKSETVLAILKKDPIWQANAESVISEVYVIVYKGAAGE